MMKDRHSLPHGRKYRDEDEVFVMDPDKNVDGLRAALVTGAAGAIET
jgi:hypothetical protein